MQIKHPIVFFYYKDLESATAFYRDALGLDMTQDLGWCKIFAITSSSFLGLVDETRGSIPGSDHKPVMLSLVVDDVDAWHKQLAASGVDGLTPPEPGAKTGYYAFFCRDPEGYTIEIISM